MDCMTAPQSVSGLQHPAITTLTPLLPVATVVLEAPAQATSALFFGQPTAAFGELHKQLLVAGLPAPADGKCIEIGQTQLGALGLLGAFSWLLYGLPKAREGRLVHQGTMLGLLSLNLQQCADGGEPLAQRANGSRRATSLD